MGETMSRIRCWSNDGELLELFIDNGANVNETDEEEGTLLHSIFNAYSDFRNENVHEMVTMIFRKGTFDLIFIKSMKYMTQMVGSEYIVSFIYQIFLI